MITEYQYLVFELVEQKAKTAVYRCKNKHYGEELGIVKWYGPWRQYCYFPTTEAVYSKGCLADINSFITQLA